jgi:hypothetical protein
VYDIETALIGVKLLSRAIPSTFVVAAGMKWFNVMHCIIYAENILFNNSNASEIAAFVRQLQYLHSPFRLNYSRFLWYKYLVPVPGPELQKQIKTMDLNNPSRSRRMEPITRNGVNNLTSSDVVVSTSPLSKYKSLLSTNTGLSQLALNEAMLANSTINDSAEYNMMITDNSLERQRLELRKIVDNNANLSHLLSLDVSRTISLESQLFSGLDSGSYRSNHYNTILVQDYLQQKQLQERQLTVNLEQNLLAQQIQLLQQQQLQLQLLDQESIHQTCGITDINNYSPTFTGEVISNNLLGNIQLPRYQQSNRQESLLAALFANQNESMVLSQQQNQVVPSTFQIFNPMNASLNSLRNQALQHSQQEVLETIDSTLGVAAEYALEGTATPIYSSNFNDDFNESHAGNTTTQEPLRALSAYNFFFRYERERILNSTNDTDDTGPELTPQTQESLLTSHWNRDRSVKRRHRKSHGKISFAELSRRISHRWKELPDDQKNFFCEIAAKDWERYHKEMDQQKPKGRLSKRKRS